MKRPGVWALCLAALCVAGSSPTANARVTSPPSGVGLDADSDAEAVIREAEAVAERQELAQKRGGVGLLARRVQQLPATQGHPAVQLVAPHASAAATPRAAASTPTPVSSSATRRSAVPKPKPLARQGAVVLSTRGDADDSTDSGSSGEDADDEEEEEEGEEEEEVAKPSFGREGAGAATRDAVTAARWREDIGTVTAGTPTLEPGSTGEKAAVVVATRKLLKENRRHQTTLRGLVSDISNSSDFGLRVDREVQEASGETAKHKVLAQVLGKMWKDMRKYISPFFLKQAESQQQWLQQRQPQLELEMAAAEADLRRHYRKVTVDAPKGTQKSGAAQRQAYLLAYVLLPSLSWALLP